MINTLKNLNIAVIGLGYVGLPLAVEFGKKYPVFGFDINLKRIKELESGYDSTMEVSKSDLEDAAFLSFTANLDEIKNCNIFIVTVPTPIDAIKQPDLSALKKASELIANVLKNDDIVIYESTVYPGCTEEICAPILEKFSGLKLRNENDNSHDNGFYIGYSPERINPGDKEHRIATIKKITSGSTKESANFIDSLYASIVTAGTHKASSIRVAEAAKVIENTQRDVNIALINELAILFNKLEIDTMEVLRAAETKWNFIPFYPGLVGGHCIGVDPYYLTHKAQSVGYTPEIILAGRKLNDKMGLYIVSKLEEAMSKKDIDIKGSCILVMGLAFKENCPDIRNTRVVDIINQLHEYDAQVDIYDPWVDVNEAKKEYEIDLISEPHQGLYDAIIIAVPHKEFIAQGSNVIKSYAKDNRIIYDIKHVLEADESDLRL